MDLWKKLNLKDHRHISIADSHGVMRDHLTTLTKSPQALSQETDFYLGFAVSLADVEAHVATVASFTGPDPVVWLAYPKASSKNYTCEFNRDTGWDGLGIIGYEPVRQVAIDEDWSALRFRKVAHIKTMTRGFAMTEEGKRKAAKPSVRNARQPNPVSAG